MFVGRNSQREALRTSWAKVVTGQPQCIVLLGESGLGKTRLAADFYSWLSCEHDLNNYWPAEISTDDGHSLFVSPKFDSVVGSNDQPSQPKQIPWLWWGMRADDHRNRNPRPTSCCLQESISELRPHLASLIDKNQSKAIYLELAKDGIGSIAETALGTTIWPLLVLWKGLEAILQRQQVKKNLLRPPDETYRQELGSLEETALQAISKVCGPRSGALPVPTIIFLDDAQWADPVTLDFIQLTLRKAAIERWPLLVIATHWEQEWRQQEVTAQAAPIANADRRLWAEPNSSPERKRPSSLAEVKASLSVAAASPVPWQLLAVSSLPECRSVLDAALPGLTPRQRDAVLHRAGDNPLILRQMIVELTRRPNLFADRDLSGVLTGQGESEIVRLETDRHRFLRDRFMELPDQVQRALGWSSLQGTTFLRSVTENAVRTCLGDAAAEILLKSIAEAQKPLSAVDLPSPYTGRFRQSAFQEVAKSMGFSDAELARAKPALRSSLIQWARSSTGENRPTDFPASEYRDALHITEAALRPEAAVADNARPDDVAWAISIAELVELYENDFLYEQALEFASRFARLIPFDGWKPEVINLTVQVSISKLLFSYNRFEDCRKIISKIINRVPGEHPDELFGLAIAESVEGQICAKEGDYAGAVKHLQETLDVIEEIGSVDDTDHLLRARAETYIHLGDIQLKINGLNPSSRGYFKGDFQRSNPINLYNCGLEGASQLLCNFDPTKSNLYFYISSSLKMAECAFRQGNIKESLNLCKVTSKKLKQILTSFKADVNFLKLLKYMEHRVARILLAEGRLDECRPRLRQIIESLALLDSEYGESPDSLNIRSSAYLDLSAVQLKLKEWNGCKENLARAFDLRQRSIELYGDLPDSQIALSDCLNLGGMLATQRGDYDGAERSFTQALDLQTSLERSFGCTYEIISRQSESHRNLASLSFRVGDNRSAIKSMVSALSLANEAYSQRGTIERSADVHFAETLFVCGEVCIEVEMDENPGQCAEETEGWEMLVDAEDILFEIDKKWTKSKAESQLLDAIRVVLDKWDTETLIATIVAAEISESESKQALLDLPNDGEEDQPRLNDPIDPDISPNR